MDEVAEGSVGLFGGKVTIESKTLRQIINAVSEREIKARYPERSDSFLEAADQYARLYKKGRRWTIPETLSPPVKEDLELLRKLDPIDLSGGIVTDLRLKALNTLDYCHNPHRMAHRTGFSEATIKSFSDEGNELIDGTVDRLIKQGYLADGIKSKSRGSHLATRKYPVFLTEDDFTKLGFADTVGFANADCGAAFVRVDDQKLTISSKGVHSSVQYVEDVRRTVVHELGHLARLRYKNKLHYRYLGQYTRLSRNLEEGSDELLTIMALSDRYPHYKSGSSSPSKYYECSKRISEHLIPELASMALRRKVDLSDFPASSRYSEIVDVITARFALGDYELLDRVTTSPKGRNIVATTSLVFEKATHFRDVKDFLEDFDIFGDTVTLTDKKPGKNGSKSRRRRIYAQNMSLSESQPIPLPLRANDSRGHLVELSPNYKYEIYEDKKWIEVKPDSIKYHPDMLLRVNRVSALSDFA